MRKHKGPARQFSRRSGLQMLAALPALSMAPAVTVRADGSDLTHAVAHDGTRIRIEIHGSGKRTVLLGPYSAMVKDAKPSLPGQASQSLEKLESLRRFYLDALTDRYRVVLFEYPGDPKMYTLTPAAVARDYLAVADAAGADEFAYFGYSWGGVTGLQLAIHTDRLTALICGGFPVVDGPYAQMLAMARALEAASDQALQTRARSSGPPEMFRQFVTYYEGLRSFDDRAAQSLIRCPRLCFVGANDEVVIDGKLIASFGRTFVERKQEMEALGWDVQILAGKDHTTAMEGDVAAPLVRRWLDANWRAKAG